MTKELYIKRREKNLTQSDVAKMLSLSTTGYCLKEKGRNDFTQSEMIKLATLFNCTLDELFMNKKGVNQKDVNQMTEQDWIKIGNQSKKVEEELSKLYNLSAQLPKDVKSQIHKARLSVGEFKSRAEDHMLKTGASEDLNIFYGTEKTGEWNENE